MTSRVVSDAWDRFTKDRPEKLKDGVARPSWLDWETRRGPPTSSRTIHTFHPRPPYRLPNA